MNEESGKRVAELTEELLRVNERLFKEIEERERVEKELRESEAKYRILADHTNDGLVIVHDGILKYANQRVAELGGSTVDLLTGTAVANHIDAKDVERVTEMGRRRLNGEDVPRTYEAVLKRRNGSLIQTELNADVITYHGEPATLVRVRDITELKGIEDALRLSEAKFRLYVNQSPFAIFIADKESRLIQVNRSACELLGYDPETLLCMNFPDLHPPEDRGDVLRDFASLYREGRVQAEHRFQRQDGSLIWVSLHLIEIEEEMCLAYCSDVTTQRQGQEALRRSEEMYRTLVTASPDSIAVTDISGQVLLASRKALELFATPEGRGIGHSIREWVAPEDQDKADEALRQLLTKGEFPFKEFALRRYDGSFFDAEVHAAPIRSSDGKIRGAIFITRDITDRKSLQAQLLQAQKMEAIGTLAGGIAHDFNNMLAIIMGNAELALEDIGPDGPRRNLEQILNASKRSRDLVKQILTFSRKNEGERTSLRLTGVIQETIQLLRASLPSTIIIKVDIRTELDSILGNPSQIQQVLMNLSMNAAQAMGEDGGTLAIGLTEKTFQMGDPLPDNEMRPGPYLRLTVRDTGAGIPKEIRKRIFDPFFTTKQRGQGTGMGLAVVFGIVKGHEGAITVRSKVGKGSVFSIYLPLSAHADEEQSLNQGALPAGDERILVVDDEPRVAEIEAAMLRRLGYHVTTAKSGSEGWRRFTADPHHFNLVITDHVMPQITGMKLAERILEVRGDLPIILATGYSETVSAEKAKSIGISEFVMKPIDARALAETVRRALDKKQGSTEHPAGCIVQTEEEHP